MSRNQYNQVDPRKAIDLQQSMMTKEQEELAEKLMRRRALNQLSVTFIASMIQGIGSQFDSKEVARKALELAEAVIDQSESIDVETSSVLS